MCLVLIKGGFEMFRWLKRRIRLRCVELAIGLHQSGESGNMSILDNARQLEDYVIKGKTK